ncbi:hypothetical protein [Peribacillus muralis]|nr:hypothetical protein [Peribacillus muralis]
MSSAQLALTTFLYAKDEQYLINDAIKYLIKKEGFGLVGLLGGSVIL